MQTVLKAFTRSYITTINTTLLHVKPARASSSLALATSSAEETQSSGSRLERSDIPKHSSLRRGRSRSHIRIGYLKRLIDHGKTTKACHYILERTTRRQLSREPLKRGLVLKALDAFLNCSANADARLRRTGDAAPVRRATAGTAAGRCWTTSRSSNSTITSRRDVVVNGVHLFLTSASKHTRPPKIAQ